MSAKIDKAVELYNKGEYDKAIDIFSSVSETETPSAELYNNIGLCYFKNGNIEKAEDNFLKAIEINPKLPQVYLNLADIYYKQRDFENGLELLSQGVYELPDNMVLRHLLARFYMEDARLDLAIDELEKILETQPENYDAYYDFGVIGVFVIALLIGVVAKVIIDIIKKSDNPVVYLFYGQIAVYLALAFFTTWFSSPATWFWLIITGMIYCYVGYDKK